MQKIGPYHLHTIETGRFGLDGGAMFGVVPKPLWQKRIQPDERNRIIMHMRCLLLEGDGRLILIDNGLGDKSADKFVQLYAVDHSTFELGRSLREVGFGLDEITDVVLTHLHFDHAGGSTVREGEKLRIAFPNATFHVQKDQWVTATSPNPRERPSFLPENLEPLASSGQVRFLERNTQLFPGIDCMVFDGHSSGMQAIRIADDVQTLVYVADLLPTTHHFSPAWTMAYDVRPLESMTEKAAFLQQAAEESWALFFEHDPDTAVANVNLGEKGPIAINHRPLREL